jgi:hypothetical protein
MEEEKRADNDDQQVNGYAVDEPGLFSECQHFFFDSS